jgi:hypothetical protein
MSKDVLFWLINVNKIYLVMLILVFIETKKITRTSCGMWSRIDLHLLQQILAKIIYFPKI